MAMLYFGRGFVPVGFLIVRDGVDPHRETPGDSVLIQSDWDYPSVASAIGFDQSRLFRDRRPTIGEVISAAYNFLYERHGQSFPQLDDYLPKWQQSVNPKAMPATESD
jgi:hypothetical protein